MVGLPNFYKTKLPASIREHKKMLKMMTGSSIALVEAILTCPIERLKVFFMTNAQTISYR